MKQLIHISFFLSVFIGSSFGQQITISPTPVDTVFEVELATAFLDLVAKSNIINNTSDTLYLKWERNIVSMPDTWDAKVCDPNLCYNDFISSNIDPDLMLNEPVVLLPNGKANLDLHFVPNGVAGTGQVEVEVALVEEPNEILAVATYNAEVVGKTTSVRDFRRRSALVYPNPSGDYLTIASEVKVAKMLIYNMVGRIVKQFNTTGYNDIYDIRDLPDGIYLVGLIDRYGEVIKTEKLSKREVRP